MNRYIFIAFPASSQTDHIHYQKSHLKMFIFKLSLLEKEIHATIFSALSSFLLQFVSALNIIYSPTAQQLQQWPKAPSTQRKLFLGLLFRACRQHKTSLFQGVRGEQLFCSAVLLCICLSLIFGLEVPGWFVEEHDRRVVHQLQSNGKALSLASRKTPSPRVGTRQQTEGCQDLLYLQGTEHSTFLKDKKPPASSLIFMEMVNQLMTAFHHPHT